MRNLRDELDRRPLWGAFIGSNSALAAELMAQAGFDWLVIDLQHAPTGGSEQLAAMLRATGSTPTLVRIPWKTDYGTAMAALDAGAQGLIVPMLDTADEAARIAGAAGISPAPQLRALAGRAADSQLHTRRRRPARAVPGADRDPGGDRKPGRDRGGARN